jgi:prepilin-type N-terminal cleavage/methylation domain-containing protein
MSVALACRRHERWHTHWRRVESRRARLGFTLIELLVVIAILLLLLAVAVPALAPPIEDRAMREASRGVNAFLAGARDRAISTGRPVGVQFMRFTPSATQTDNLGAAATALPQDVRTANSCFLLQYVQVPPPYAGDFETSRMTVAYNSGSGTSTINAAGPMGTAGDTPVGLIRRGDLVQFGGVGHLYVIEGGTLDGNGFIAALDNTCTLRSETNTFPLAIDAPGLPYQIFRSPVKAPGAPFPIPESVVLDLTASGISGIEFYSAAVNTNPVTIMFAPSGGVDRVYYGAAGDATLVQGERPTGAVYLMLGRPNQLSGFTAGIANWQDLKNLWVSVNARTGLIQSNETACDPANAAPLDLFESRTYARERQGMGGR